MLYEFILSLQRTVSNIDPAMQWGWKADPWSRDSMEAASRNSGLS